MFGTENANISRMLKSRLSHLSLNISEVWTLPLNVIVKKKTTPIFFFCVPSVSLTLQKPPLSIQKVVVLDFLELVCVYTFICVEIKTNTETVVFRMFQKRCRRRWYHRTDFFNFCPWSRSDWGESQTRVFVLGYSSSLSVLLTANPMSLWQVILVKVFWVTYLLTYLLSRVTSQKPMLSHTLLSGVTKMGDERESLRESLDDTLRHLLPWDHDRVCHR